MPWVYTLRLSEYNNVGEVQSDWQSIAGEQIAHAYGGVTVSGTKAIVVSTRREPNYTDMQSNFGYVNSVTESKEIPAEPDSMELGLGIRCEFDDVQ